jgi:hypothetical protein
MLWRYNVELTQKIQSVQDRLEGPFWSIGGKVGLHIVGRTLCSSLLLQSSQQGQMSDLLGGKQVRTPLVLGTRECWIPSGSETPSRVQSHDLTIVVTVTGKQLFLALLPSSRIQDCIIISKVVISKVSQWINPLKSPEVFLSSIQRKQNHRLVDPLHYTGPYFMSLMRIQLIMLPLLFRTYDKVKLEHRLCDFRMTFKHLNSL